MRRLIFCILVMLVVFLPSLLSQASDKLQIRIWTDKDQFFVQEPIPVHYEIKNISDSTIRLCFTMIYEDFIIKDEQGRGYAPHIRGSYGACRDSLKPGEIHQARLDVSGYGLKNIGEYTCYIYTQPSNVLHFPWTKSNTIKFKVIEPTGEEKEALEMFIEAGTVETVEEENQGRCPKRGEPEFLRYEALVEKYPNSVYAPLALREAIGIYFYSRDLQERRKIIPVCKRLIENYPNSLYFASAFMSLVDVYEILKDKEGAIKTMQELIEKHPNTKISERAEYWLEKIKKWEFE
jgi:tetratricopeptide (TPR) repeat protein